MFLNFTNHPSAQWAAPQQQAAGAYGPIRDLPFPAVPPAAGSAALDRMADRWADRIAGMHPDCVLCQGEMTLTYRIVQRLLAQGIPVVAACSERHSREWTNAQGKVCRVTAFEFVQFRPYAEPAPGLAIAPKPEYTQSK